MIVRRDGIDNLYRAESTKNGLSGPAGTSVKPGKGGNYNTDRAPDGLINPNCNGVGVDPTAPSEIVFYHIETEYLRFVYEINLELENSRLINRNFVKSVIDENYFRPDILSLLERVQMFNQFEYGLLPNLKNEIFDYYYNQNPSLPEQLVLNFTLASISSSIFRYNAFQETALVINVEKFLHLTFGQIKQWKSLSQQSIRDVYKVNYESNLKKKIDDAIELINILQKDIEENEREINRNIANVLLEISRLKNAVYNEHLRLQDELKKLRKNIAMRNMFSALSTVAQFASFLVPYGALVGGVMQAGLSVASQFSIKGGDTSSRLAHLNSAVIAYKNYIAERKNERMAKLRNEAEVLEIENQLEKIGKNKEMQINMEESLEAKIEGLPVSAKKYELSIKHFELLRIGAILNSNKMEKQMFEGKIKEATEDLKTTKRINFLENVSTEIHAAKLVVDLHQEIKVSKNEIDALKQEIEDNIARYNGLLGWEDQISEYHNNELKRATDELYAFTQSLSGNSLPTLSFKKWELKSFMTKLNNELEMLLNSFDTKTEVFNTVKRIENAIVTIVDMFGHVEGFVQQTEFANYIADMTRTNIAIGIPEFYQQKVNAIEKTILANIIVERYVQAVEAFKYWSFPFFCEYTQDLVVYNEKNTFDNNDVMINSYSNVLTKLLEKIQNYEIQLKPSIHNHIQSFSFDKETPFFKWSYESYPYEVKKFLNGKMATFHADINFAKYDAIKFCTLYLLAEVKSSVILNETLNTLLGNFYVELTHSGSSSYKFKSKIYMINSDYYSGEKLLLRYQYGSTNSENANESFKKLASNKPMLSTYTFWQIKLNPIKHPENRELFKEIAKLVKNTTDITLSLCGKGQYVSDGLRISNSNADCGRVKRSKKELSCNLTYDKLVYPL